GTSSVEPDQAPARPGQAPTGSLCPQVAVGTEITALKVLHVCASDLDGGAARAAYRIHRALVEHGPSLGIESRMRVLQKLSDDPTVIDGRPAGETALWRRLQPRLANWRYKSFHTDNPVLHSVAWPATGLGDELNQSDADVVHLHWLGNGTLSVEEI